MTSVFINGRFLTQRTTGVQRYATEIVRALDTLLCRSAADQLKFVLLIPKSGEPPSWMRNIESRVVGRFTGQLWEQLELPRYSRDGISLNLCNTAPLMARSVVVAIHDAGAFAVPETYSRAFRTWYRLLHSQLGRRAVQIVTVSRFSQSQLVRYAGMDADRIAIIRNGGEHILSSPADPSILERLRLRRRYILAVSSQSPHKNLGGVLSAVEQLGGRDFDVVFAGGSNPRVFRQGVQGSGAARLAGYVNDGELRALYENAECFVYPSLYEGFGLPPLEAMTCGCPVVVSQAASLPEVCGDAAVYCDPQNTQDIARAIAEVLGDATLRTDLKQRGLERARHFTWPAAAGSLLNLVQRLSAR
jgi:glycosyltransferase involved in cell wall biosynthesis